MISTSRRVAETRRFLVFDMLKRKAGEGFAEISLVDQSQLQPSSQLPSADLCPHMDFCEFAFTITMHVQPG